MSNISKIKIKNADGTEKEYNVSDSDIGAKIGDLDELITEDKSNLVNAINEVSENASGNNFVDVTLDEYNAMETHDPDTYYNVIDDVVSEEDYQLRLLEIEQNVGNLEELSVEDKSSLVNAINEVASKGGLDTEETQAKIEEIDFVLGVLTNVGKPAENTASFNSAGTHTWTCPQKVFKVCALIQGGGQGGIRYAIDRIGLDDPYYCGIPEQPSGKAIFVENIPVAPGQTYTFTVGAGGNIGDAPAEAGIFGTFGSAGSMGGESEAFGYSSDNSKFFKYQYIQNAKPGGTYEINSGYAKAREATLNGTIDNVYTTSGSYSYKNGASKKGFSCSKNSTASGNSGAGKAGIVVLWYN